MIWIIILLGKLFFGYFLYKLFSELKVNSVDLESLELISNNSRKQMKFLYWIFGTVMLVSILVSMSFEKWQEKRNQAEFEQLALLEEWENNLEIDEEQEKEIKGGLICLDEELSFTGNGHLDFYNKKGNKYDISGILEGTPFKGTVLFENDHFRISGGNVQGIIDLADGCSKIRGMIKVKDNYGGWKNCLLNHIRK